MASTITIICPECEKPIKASDEVVGKKIRCKGCGETFTAKAPKSSGKAAPPKPKKEAEGEEEGAYGVTDEYLGARCPECAEKMGDEDRICLACGYDTIRRTKPKQRKVLEQTGGDYFIWLLPGILSVIGIIVLVTIQLMYILMVTEEGLGGDANWYSFLGGKALKIWSAIITLFILFFAGKFAIKRLIFDYQPPEIEEKWHK